MTLKKIKVIDKRFDPHFWKKTIDILLLSWSKNSILKPKKEKKKKNTKLPLFI